MNNTGFKTIFFLIGVLLLGCSLIMSCTKTTATETHPESGYEEVLVVMEGIGTKSIKNLYSQIRIDYYGS